MRADFWTKSPQQKLSDIGPKGSKKVKNCTKLVHFFTRDGRLRSKWTLFTLFGHYFKNTHSNHSLPLITATRETVIMYVMYIIMTAIPTKHWVQRRKHQVRDINIYILTF